MSSCDTRATTATPTPVASVGPKKFAESVSVSSTVFADLPLAGTAFELGFDLLRFRARRKRESRAPAGADQGLEKTQRPQFAEIQLSTFPQQGVQLVDNPETTEAIESAPCHTSELPRSRAASSPSSGPSSSASTSGSEASRSACTAAPRSSSAPCSASWCFCW